MSLHFLLFLLSHLNLSVKVVLIGNFITHSKTIHSEQNFLQGINRERETTSPLSSLNYTVTAEQWNGRVRVINTGTWTAMPHNGMIILEVTLWSAENRWLVTVVLS